MSELFQPESNHEIFVASITPVKIIAALSRRAKGGTISRMNANLACNQFSSDCASELQIIDLNETLIRQAMALAEKMWITRLRCSTIVGSM